MKCVERACTKEHGTALLLINKLVVAHGSIPILHVQVSGYITREMEDHFLECQERHVPCKGIVLITAISIQNNFVNKREKAMSPFGRGCKT